MCSHGERKERDLMHFKVRQNFHRAERPWQPAAAISVCMCALTTGGHSLIGSSTTRLRSGRGISHDRTRSRSAVCIGLNTPVVLIVTKTKKTDAFVAYIFHVLFYAVFVQVITGLRGIELLSLVDVRRFEMVKVNIQRVSTCTQIDCMQSTTEHHFLSQARRRRNIYFNEKREITN